MNALALGFRTASKADFQTFGGASADSVLLETGDDFGMAATVVYSAKDRLTEVIVVGHTADPHTTYHRIYSGHYAVIAAMAAPELLKEIKASTALFQLTSLGLEAC